jgi:hypothetical protein
VSVVFFVLVVVVVFVIAAVVIGREARRLGAVPPRPVFDLDEAVEFVADHLPFEVSAQLSHDDVRQLLRWHLDYFRTRGVTGNGDSTSAPTGPVVMGGAETVEYVLERAGQAGLEVTASQVHAVVEAQLLYLRSIGAVQSYEPPDEG